MLTKGDYIMLVFEEDERYPKEVPLSLYANNPSEGHLSDIVFGNSATELMEHGNGADNEGLFYILYRIEGQTDSRYPIGRRIGSGVLNFDAVCEDIDLYEKSKFVKKDCLLCDVDIPTSSKSMNHTCSEADIDADFDPSIAECIKSRILKTSEEKEKLTFDALCEDINLYEKESGVSK